MKILKLIFSSFAMLLFFAPSMTLDAQCKTWNDHPQKDELEEAHVLYRQFVKSEEYDLAFDYWKKAYDGAPAADGQRTSHFTDGRTIYTHMYKNETDGNKKAEYKQIVLDLYEAEKDCFKKESYILGRKGYDLVYTFNAPTEESYATLKEAATVGKNSTEYIVLGPLAGATVNMFAEEKIDKAEARMMHDLIMEVADHNIASNEKMKAYYEHAKLTATNQFTSIEYHIFDCDYFKIKLEPDFRANPNDPQLAKEIYNNLRQRGCEDADPLMVELKGKYESWAAQENAQRLAVFEANNPAMMAKKSYDEGNYSVAVNKYDEAIAQEADPAKKASYLFSKASILGRKLNQYSDARRAALDAANLKPGWGNPYMLIGDLYAKSARNCGDSWNQRVAVLAAIGKYRKAKSVDPSKADEASNKIRKYSASKPSKDEAFMRGHKKGDKVKCKCWIGETVTLDF